MLAKVWRAIKLPTRAQLAIMRVFQDEFLVGSTGIFFDDKDRILLVRHTYRGGWSLPGGYIKSKEHPREGLEREIKEETGFDVSVDEELKLRADTSTARLDIVYMGTFIGGAFIASREVKKAGLFSYDELPLLSKDQLIFIDKARQERKFHKNHTPTKSIT